MGVFWQVRGGERERDSDHGVPDQPRRQRHGRGGGGGEAEAEKLAHQAQPGQEGGERRGRGQERVFAKNGEIG
jgi:hypothetical protein